MPIEDQVHRLLTELANARSQLRVGQFGAGKGTSGGGDSDEPSRDWKAGVDRQLAQLHSDVRNLLYALLAGVVLLAGGGWVFYDKLSGQLTELRVTQAELVGSSKVLDTKLDMVAGKRPVGPEGRGKP